MKAQVCNKSHCFYLDFLSIFSSLQDWAEIEPQLGLQKQLLGKTKGKSNYCFPANHACLHLLKANLVRIGLILLDISMILNSRHEPYLISDRTPYLISGAKEDQPSHRGWGHVRLEIDSWNPECKTSALDISATSFELQCRKGFFVCLFGSLSMVYVISPVHL